MGQSEYVEVDPGYLRLPPSRSSGADPAKLIRQISRFGDSADGMPPVWVYRGSDEELMIFDGVTRATRVAKLRPGLTITVEVVGEFSYEFNHLPTVREKLP